MKWWFRNWRRDVRDKLARFVCLKIFKMQTFQICQEVTPDFAQTWNVYGHIVMTDIKIHMKASPIFEVADVKVEVNP